MIKHFSSEEKEKEERKRRKLIIIAIGILHISHVLLSSYVGFKYI